VSGIADIFIKELSERYLALPLPLAQELLTAPDTVSRISVILKEPAREPEAASAPRGATRTSRHFTGVKIWRELAIFYQQVRMLYLAIFGFMGAVLLVVVFLSTANTTLMSVTERTREIGTLRALGARAQRITTNFILEGALLGPDQFGGGNRAESAHHVRHQRRAHRNAATTRLGPGFHHQRADYSVRVPGRRRGHDPHAGTGLVLPGAARGARHPSWSRSRMFEILAAFHARWPPDPMPRRC